MTGLVGGLIHTEGAQYDVGKGEGCQRAATWQLCLLLDVVQDIKDIDIRDLKKMMLVCLVFPHVACQSAIQVRVPMGLLITLPPLDFFVL